LRVDPRNGILLGLTPLDNSKVLITFSKKFGVQTWHFEEPDCGKCHYTRRCTERLLYEAEERGVSLDATQKELPPSKLAHLIFSSLIPELKA